MQREDVGVLQVRGRPDLGEKACGAAGDDEVGAQDLDRDLAVVLEVASGEDGGHAAGADLAFDGVTATKGVGEAAGGAANGAETLGAGRRRRHCVIP